MAVAETFEDALRLGKWLTRKNHKRGVRPARIGSVQGETLDGHISCAIGEGCSLIACIAGWEGDEPVWKYIDMES